MSCPSFPLAHSEVDGSPVFRLVLETTHVSSSPIPLPVHSSDLVILRALLDASPSPHLPLVSLNLTLLCLCETFDMPVLACKLLRSTRLPADYHPRTCRSSATDRLDMFVWAGKLDCPDVGAKVLLDLAYADPTTVCRRMPGGSGFDRDTARMLRPDWVWAVDRARGDTIAAGVEWGDGGYWTAVGLSFAELMLR